MEVGDDHGRTPMKVFAPPTDPPVWKSTQPAMAETHSVIKEPGFIASNACQNMASGTADLGDVYMATPDTKAVPSTNTGFEPKDASYVS